MTHLELREKLFEYFKAHGHVIIPSASLIPENDPSVLFTTAGMHPLVPFLMGEKHPAGTRLANIQKCIRTGDIDEVGDGSHHTFFEMFGNWSLGDYFKKEAIEMSWEFLTSDKWLGLDKNRFTISVFEGDADAPFDQEAYDVWRNLGIPEEKIKRLPKSDNWWGLETGPCGPDTEIFYDGIEIWNNVFMQYNKTPDGRYELLKQKNVDTGMGFERLTAAVNGLDDDYKTDLFLPIINELESIWGQKYEDNSKIFRIIADHIKASVFIISDGVLPSNKGNGYVLRRLLRRVMVQLYLHDHVSLNIESLLRLIRSIVKIYEPVYPLLSQSKVEEIVNTEYDKFNKTLVDGVVELKKFFNKFISGVDPEKNNMTIRDNLVSGRGLGIELFKIFESKGLHPDIASDVLRKWGLILDKEVVVEYRQAILEAQLKHQDLSRTAAAGMFKGGLADTSVETTRLHTAAHLTLEALRRVLGTHVQQKGSNITAKRMRFDFSHGEKMTPEQIKQVEDIVNEQITKKLPVHFEEMTLDEAKAINATGMFEHKYGERVKVYMVGTKGNYFSKEICGGPHVNNTGEIGYYKIIKEESASAGTRRIKAIASF